MVVKIHNCTGAPGLFGFRTSHCDFPKTENPTYISLREFSSNLRMVGVAAARKLPSSFKNPPSLRLAPNAPKPPPMAPLSPWAAALLAGVAAYEVYRSWDDAHIPIIDAPPRTTPIDQWIAEVHELGDLMQHMAELQVMMRVYEMFGFTSLVHKLRDELEGLQIQMATAASGYPVMGNRLEIKASAEGGNTTSGSPTSTNEDKLPPTPEEHHQSSLIFYQSFRADIHVLTLSGGNDLKRRDAAKALRQLHPEAAKVAIQALRNAGHSRDEFLVLESGLTLLHIGAIEDAVALLSQCLLKDSYIALSAVKALGDIGSAARAALPDIDSAISFLEHSKVGPFIEARNKIDPEETHPTIGQKRTAALIAILNNATQVGEIDRKIEAATELGQRRDDYEGARDALLAVVAQTTGMTGKEAELYRAAVVSLTKFGVVVVTPPRSPHTLPTTGNATPAPAKISPETAATSLASVLGIPESNVQHYLVGLVEQDFTITMEVSGKCDDHKYQQALIAALKVAVRAEIPKAHKALDRVMRFSQPDID